MIELKSLEVCLLNDGDRCKRTNTVGSHAKGTAKV